MAATTDPSRPQPGATAEPTDWRAEWADLQGTTYLNFAAHGLLPRVAVQAVERALQAKSLPHRVPESQFFETATLVRTRLSTLLRANPEDIAIVTGAGAGAATVGSALRWQPGDEILIPQGEFPLQHAIWGPLAARHQLTLRIVEPRGPFIHTADLIAALGPRSRVVSASHVRFDDGALLDVEPLSAACRARGVLLLLDVSQSCGAMPLDVDALGADVLIAAGYKYLLGPWGTGFLWIRRGCLDALGPLPFNWMAQGAQEFAALRYTDPAPAAGAMCLDAAEYASPYNFNLAAMAAALELVLRADPAVILQHNRALIDQLYAGLPLPCQPASPQVAAQRGSFGCFSAGSPAQTSQIFERLRQHHVIVALRQGRIRVAPHLCTTPQDIDRVLAILHDFAKESP